MTRIAPIIVGLLMILSNAFWAYFYASIWYNQEYLKLLVMFWHFPLMLYLNIIGGALGILLGGFVLFRKIKIADGIFININIFIMVALLSLLLY